MLYSSQKARPYKWRGNSHKSDDTPASPPPLLGPLILSLHKEDIKEAAKELSADAAIQDCRHVASYNWLDKNGSVATILLPGKNWSSLLHYQILTCFVGQPPLWTPMPGSVQLRADGGQYFRDKNAARFPKHPLELAVAACLESSPNLPTEIEVVACGSTLGNLLRFVRGQDKPFRMLVEKVGSTVFFIRRENTPTELIPNVHGYGHSFPEAFTTWEPAVRGSASHQRVIRYTFGGLTFLVRSEADGYIKDGATDSKPLSLKGTNVGGLNPTLEKPSPPASVDELAKLLSISTFTGSQKSTTQASRLRIDVGGNLINQSQLFDLKTRSIVTAGRDYLAEELPRLWVSQIPNFILAFHTRGMFRASDIQVRNVREDVRQWEVEHNDELGQLGALVRRIVNFSLSTKARNGKLELCHDAVGRLDVREQLPDAGDVLSEGLRTRWEAASDRVLDERDEAGASLFEWDDTGEKDFTACSEFCSYCGGCNTY
ncbi:hypothetical protein TOPH_07771 [Tolypocladium ophioglossoides CBS 100239]|uniref:Geranylgeranyl pyrophosphate synthetase n=1 Tax=Tolypocladium ophioglossoides (strain CBS 100239) TaxID=1163406 RepID=A0A0L0N0G6_TOLOC|nr:hypothetical protein TOPH_07771 [Tolypocladium ophioglossoides CBS 100239]